MNKSSRGRVLKRSGIDDKKMEALNKLRETREGAIRPLDAYKVRFYILIILFFSAITLSLNIYLINYFQFLSRKNQNLFIFLQKSTYLAHIFYFLMLKCFQI